MIFRPRVSQVLLVLLIAGMTWVTILASHYL